MRRIALAAGLMLTALAVAVTLTGSPVVARYSNSIQTGDLLTVIDVPASVCQGGEEVPAGASAMRLSLFAVTGPRLTVRIHAPRGVVAEGTRGSGWIGEFVTVPFTRLTRHVPNAVICVTLGTAGEGVHLIGTHSDSEAVLVRSHGREQRVRGQMRIEYVQSLRRSWLSLAGSIVRHMTVGHAPGGPAAIVLLATLMAAAVVAAAWLTVRELQ